jgi:hypothetical protein
VGREGFNCTLTGQHDAVRRFTNALKVTFTRTSNRDHKAIFNVKNFKFEPFGHTDFKYVDYQPDNQMLKGLKVVIMSLD